MIKKLILFFTLILGTAFNSFSQSMVEYEMAVNYYQRAEYDKAEDLFGRLFDKQPEMYVYYAYYYNCLIVLKKYDKAQSVAKKQNKRFPENPNYGIDYGYALKVDGKLEKAKDEYEKALKLINGNPNLASQISYAFRGRSEAEYAIVALQKARQVTGDKGLFALDLAEAYFQQNNKEGMVNSYLELLESQPNQLMYVQNMIQARLDEDDYAMLKNALIKNVQQSPDNFALSEFMIWYFVQQKDYETAFIQAKSIEKRQREDGSRILNLARIAADNLRWSDALMMYQYILDKGNTNAYFITAGNEYLDISMKQILANGNYTQEQLLQLETRFKNYLAQTSVSAATIPVQQNLALLQARYLNKCNDAIEVLENALKIPGVHARTRANIKLDLGDYYLISGDVWEPSLLYGQVEKDFKDEPLGQDAKFKNSRISFYRGEFEWAQAQLNVLKTATSQFVSNDALRLALIIQDNLGMDSTVIPMEMYARADLLIFQHKYTEAIATFDSLLLEFPAHPLTDEIAFAKGQIAETQQKWDEAIKQYTFVKTYNDADILADDALFRMAEIYEINLKNKQKASELYEELITKFSNSTFAVEARKRFRALRGDKISG